MFSKSKLPSEFKWLDPYTSESKNLWNDLSHRHHLYILSSPKLILQRLLYRDSTTSFSRIFKIDFYPSCLALKSFLILKKHNKVTAFPLMANPAHEIWFIEKYILREHLDFIFNFYSFFDNQSIILPHLSFELQNYMNTSSTLKPLEPSLKRYSDNIPAEIFWLLDKSFPLEYYLNKLDQYKHSNDSISSFHLPSNFFFFFN
jgi:hypothetical protein